MRKNNLLSGKSPVIGLALFGLVGPWAAMAGTLECDGPISDMYIDGNLKVLPGPLCDLRNVEVKNDVTVEKDARLRSRDSIIGGNLRGRDRSRLTVIRTEVGNDVQVSRAERVRVLDSIIGKNLTIDKASTEGFAMEVTGNTIDNDATIKENVTDALTVTDNVVGGNLKCEKNDPAPVVSGNVVSGDVKAQCSEP